LQEFNPEEQQDPQKPAGSFIRNLNPFAYTIIVLVVIFFLYQFIGASLALAAGAMDGLDNLNVKTTRVVLAFGQFMFILAPTIFFARFQTGDLKSMFRLSPPKPLLMFLAIAGIILIQPFLQGYMYLQEQLITQTPFLNDIFRPIKEVFDSLESSTMKIVQAHGIAEFITVVFVICITPAICEEALFRGFTLTNLSKVSKASVAIFMSGFLFAFYHFQPFNIVPLIILGCYLGFIVYYSNSIWVGIVCHFLNNFFATYFLYMYGKEEFETPKLTGDELTNTISAAALSLVLFASVIFLYYRFRQKLQPVSTGEESA
jgi:uncharacterized protein